MSHDQKPGKVRVVGGVAAIPRRRMADGTPGATDAGSAGRTVGAPSPSTAPAPRPRHAALLPMLFIVGCAAGGAALPLLGGF